MDANNEQAVMEAAHKAQVEYVLRTRLIKAAYLHLTQVRIRGNPYHVDVAAYNGFKLGLQAMGVDDVEAFLRDKLGADYPEALPSNFLYSEGL